MFFWYVGPSIVGVYEIFRSRGLDYRLIALGALAAAARRPAVRRTIGVRALARASRSAVLAVVMLGTIGRSRLLRRRLVCLPIGWFCGLVLSGAFLHDAVVPLAAARHGRPGRRRPAPAAHAARAARGGRVRGRASGAWGRFGLDRPRDPRTRSCARGRLPGRTARGDPLRPARRDRGQPGAPRARTRRSAAHRRAVATRPRRSRTRLARVGRRRGVQQPAARAPGRPRTRSRRALGVAGRGRRPARRARLRRVGRRALPGPAARGAARAGAPTRRSRRPAARACARSARASAASARELARRARPSSR